MTASPKSHSPSTSSQHVGGIVDRSRASKADRPRKTRVKTGCVTCRIRRIKCDEKRPSCEKCTSTGRKCDGYPSLPMSRKDLPVAVHNRKTMLLSCHQVAGISGFDNGTEMLYFDFFRRRTSPGTNHFLGSDFWERLVLQMSHSEPAIKHVVVAISALHQQWDMYRSTAYVNDSGAVTQYGKGVRAAQEMLRRTKPGTHARKEEIEPLLVACVLFVCFEYLIGDYTKAAMHLSHALQVLDGEGLTLSARGAHSRIDATIVELLNRFDFQAMTFTQTQFALRHAAVRFRKHPPTPLPVYFETLTEIRSSLFEQVNWALAIGEVLALSRAGVELYPDQRPEETFIDASRELERAEATVLHLWDLIDEFIDRVCIPLDPAYRSSVTYSYLRVYHHTSAILVMAGCTGYEMSWDLCMPEWQLNLDLLDELQSARIHEDDNYSGSGSGSRAGATVPPATLSLETGICIPLFMIASKCREPSLRRRAIAILERSDRKEGIWETVATARVVARTQHVEEEEARRIRAAQTGIPAKDIPIVCAADIPEEARSQICFTHVDMAARTVKLEYRFRSGTIEEATWRSRHERVEF